MPSVKKKITKIIGSKGYFYLEKLSYLNITKLGCVMSRQPRQQKKIWFSLAFIILFGFSPQHVIASDNINSGNFNLPGIIDLPTAKRFPDGELVVSQQIHGTLARTGLSFQALPRVGFAFRYTGHGTGGKEAYGRANHDRSFDAHISVSDESKYLPAISSGLRDFIGTGWYSSEYIVGTKSIGNLELTAGLGFGRLSGRNSFSNPFGILSSRFDTRQRNKIGRGNSRYNSWFHGDTSPFYGLTYKLDERLMLSAEFTPDIMSRESNYLSIESPWNFGASYSLNDYLTLSTQYLHGSQLSVAANIKVNPGRPPILGGKELAPVQCALEAETHPIKKSDKILITKVLEADRFRVHYLKFEGEKVTIAVTNTKFRHWALGRVGSTLQRFTSDDITIATSALFLKAYKLQLIA